VGRELRPFPHTLTGEGDGRGRPTKVFGKGVPGEKHGGFRVDGKTGGLVQHRGVLQELVVEGWGQQNAQGWINMVLVGCAGVWLSGGKGCQNLIYKDVLREI